MTRIYLPALTSAAPAPPTTHPGDWLWLLWVLAFVVIELALYVWRGTPATFSGLIWRWQDGAPGDVRGRRIRRLVLGAALAWLGWHLVGGGRW